MLKTFSCLLLLSSPVLAGALDTPVVGGQPAKAGEFPEVVLVAAPNALCTGTLIAPDLVLTAGHCIETHPTYVVVDTVDISKPGGEKIAIKQAIAYPNWQKAYDVGLLVLDHPAKAKPAAIASACTIKQHLRPGATARIVGFGLTSKAGSGSNNLLNSATLPIVDATCKKDAACNPKINPNGEFTAGGKTTDSCFGDSGGPLFADALHGAALMGVVSRGIATNMAEPCGGGGVYERADRVVKWIEKTTKKKLARATCGAKQDETTFDDYADGVMADEETTDGGCSAGGGFAGGTALLVIAAMSVISLMRRRDARHMA